MKTTQVRSRLHDVSDSSISAHSSGRIAALRGARACGVRRHAPNAPPPKDIVPATIRGCHRHDSRRGWLGRGIPLTVTVKNEAGEPLDTTLVTFAVATGGGSVCQPNGAHELASGQANDHVDARLDDRRSDRHGDGRHARRRHLARSRDGRSPRDDHRRLPATRRPPSSAPTSPSRRPVKVADQFGNPLAGQLVTFAVGAAAARLPAPR